MKKVLIIFIFILNNLIVAATIYINVHNINGNLVRGAYVKLYDSNWSLIATGYTNNSGMVTFALLDYGNYNYEVFYTGDAQEFWGSKENITLQQPTLTSNFTRNWPYRYSYNLPPATVFTNNQVTFDITIKNKLSFSRNVKIEIWIDRDQSASWDFHQTSAQQSISGNGTKTFTFSFTPTISGTYYWKMHVLSYNDGAGNFIVTDSYFWSNAFEVTENQDFPINSGAIIYHCYSDYDAWDSKLFMYNFETNTKTELSLGWNIDNEMNADISPDGSKIVFMGDNSGLPRDWDIYIWSIGSNNEPTNLTLGNNLRDEDPKFSPDGNSIIFKQNGDIKIMDLLGNIITEITNDGFNIEESMPYFTTDAQKIIYAQGAREHSDIYLINLDGSGKIPLYSQNGVAEYYPIVKNSSSFYYTRWVSSTNHNDQIYLGDFLGNSTNVSVNDLYSNNSDAFPVNSDYLFFSSTRNGSVGGYDIYLGQLSTGLVWNLQSFGINSSLAELGVCYSPHILLGVNDRNTIVSIPNNFFLSNNYPNPFNPTTTIRYAIANVETQDFASLQNVTLKVYDALGREVATLVDKKQAPGKYSVQFDAVELPSGVYFYTLRAGNFVQTKKMLLLK